METHDLRRAISNKPRRIRDAFCTTYDVSDTSEKSSTRPREMYVCNRMLTLPYAFSVPPYGCCSAAYAAAPGGYRRRSSRSARTLAPIAPCIQPQFNENKGGVP